MPRSAVTSVQDLRRITEGVAQLYDRTVRDVKIRSDCRQLRIGLDDGRILLVSATVDEDGAARLDVDVLKMRDELPRAQLEVHFDRSQISKSQAKI